MKSLLLPALVLIIGGCVVQGSRDNTPVAIAGNVNLIWTFSDGETCPRLAGVVDHIQVHIPGQTIQNAGTFSCEIAGAQGVELLDFAPGTYSISVIAVDSIGSPLYTWSGSFTVNGDVPVNALLVPVSPTPQAGDVTLEWSFNDGHTCADLAGLVDHIEITIPGEPLQNAGAYPCEVAGSMGIILNNFAPAEYNLTVQAVDASGAPLYSFSGSFSVNGDELVMVPLAPLAQQAQPGNVDVLWSFTDGRSCAALGGLVDHIQVSIPGEALQNGGAYPCEAAGSMGIELDNFVPGDYNISVQAVDASGAPLYEFSGSFTVDGDVTVQVPLAPVAQSLSPGNITFLWTFSDGNTCSSLAGTVASVQVSIPGQTLQNNGNYPCETAGAQGIEVDDFVGGDYAYTIDALDVGGSVVYSDTGSFEVNGDVNVDVVLQPFH